MIAIGFFILVILAAFFIPVLQLKAYVDLKKRELILESHATLNNMISKFKESSELDLKPAILIAIHYLIYHRGLYSLRNYPFDTRLILELAASFLIPIGVTVLEFLR